MALGNPDVGQKYIVLNKLWKAENPFSSICFITNCIQPCFTIQPLRDTEMKLNDNIKVLQTHKDSPIIKCQQRRLLQIQT